VVWQNVIDKVFGHKEIVFVPIVFVHQLPVSGMDTSQPVPHHTIIVTTLVSSIAFDKECSPHPFPSSKAQFVPVRTRQVGLIRL
jgi:hypothetical protein